MYTGNRFEMKNKTGLQRSEKERYPKDLKRVYYILACVTSDVR